MLTGNRAPRFLAAVSAISATCDPPRKRPPPPSSAPGASLMRSRNGVTGMRGGGARAEIV